MDLDLAVHQFISFTLMLSSKLLSTINATFTWNFLHYDTKCCAIQSDTFLSNDTHNSPLMLHELGYSQLKWLILMLM